jgi:hypothetical protein
MVFFKVNIRFPERGSWDIGNSTMYSVWGKWFKRRHLHTKKAKCYNFSLQKSSIARNHEDDFMHVSAPSLIEAWNCHWFWGSMLEVIKEIERRYSMELIASNTVSCTCCSTTSNKYTRSGAVCFWRASRTFLAMHYYPEESRLYSAHTHISHKCSPSAYQAYISVSVFYFSVSVLVQRLFFAFCCYLGLKILDY